MKKQESDKSSSCLISPLKLIFKYYCKLNANNLKHANFENANQKAQMMNLHQFMTFCKNLQITTKQHKKNDNHILSSFLLSKRKKLGVDENEGMKKEQQSIALQKNNTQMVKLAKSNLQEKSIQLQQNQFYHQPNQKSNLQEKTISGTKLPNNYLDEKKIAQIFKRYTLETGQINFESFIKILETISQKMYSQANTQTLSKNTEKTENSKQNESFTNLLTLINLQTKQRVLETFTMINKIHGNMDHLSLLRSPIKKIKVKNDPLGKYSNKQNSTLIKNTAKQQQKFPVLTKKRLKTQKNYIKNETKSSNKSKIQDFMSINKSQIELLNKSYLQKSKYLKTQQIKLVQNHSLNIIKKQKKYSQRHKQKVIVQIKKRQIDDLIDTSCLYDDEIFNKYVQLNYKCQQKNKCKIKQN